MIKISKREINRRLFLQGLAYGGGALALPTALYGCNSSSGGSQTTTEDGSTDTTIGDTSGGGATDAFSFPGFGPDRYHITMTHSSFADNIFYIIPEYTASTAQWASYATIPINWSTMLTGSDGMAHGAMLQTEISSGVSKIEFRPDTTDPMILHVIATFTAGPDAAVDAWTSLRFGRNSFRGPYECLAFNVDVMTNGYVEHNGVQEQILAFYPGYNKRFVLPHTEATGIVEYKGLYGETIDKWPVSERAMNGHQVYFTGVDDQNGYGLVWQDGTLKSIGLQNWNEWEIVCSPHIDINYGDVAAGETVTRKAAFIFTDTGYDDFASRANAWRSGDHQPV